MKIVVCSDLHDLSGFNNVYHIIDFERPDLLLSCGDFGSNQMPQKKHVLERISKRFLKMDLQEYEDLFKPILKKTRLHAVYGNHDILNILCNLHNHDGTRCWLRDCVPTEIGEKLTVMGINGNFAKKVKFPWNTTEAKVLSAFKAMPPHFPVNITLSHEAVYGCSESNKGVPILRDICEKLKPKYWFSGHLHYRSHKMLACGTLVVGIESTLRGHYVLLDAGNVDFCNIGRKT